MSVDTKKLVTGVDFVCVPTQDITKAMDFYENVLGLEPSKRWQRDEDEEPMGAEFEPGDVTIALLNTGKLGIEFQASTVPVAYQVDDVEAARAELESRGVSFVADTMDSGVCHMAHFTDPDGNVLMLHNRYAPKGERPKAATLGRQLHSPRACLACQALVGVAVRGIEAHVLRVPAGGEVALVRGVRVQRRQQVGGVAERRRPKRRHEAEPGARAGAATQGRTGTEEAAPSREPEGAEHVGGPLDVRDQDAPGIGIGIEQELSAISSNRSAGAGPSSPRAGHGPPLETGAREHRPALGLAAGGRVAGEQRRAGGLKVRRGLHYDAACAGSGTASTGSRASICSSLASRFSAIRIDAASISRPSSETAPFPSAAASLIASMMRRVRSTSRGAGV